ncbi:zinc finger MYM-type protein 1-like [Leptopilina heterotoma]|uniref:zinc finger MYM-type protein 1-like n=1 Tax=Leptopilina heterotoma TaxID=63436 RepID=UPI001CA81854|nr:zinc finger MYM-type protein 1-like [Leptopilina heterotoma]
MSSSKRIYPSGAKKRKLKSEIEASIKKLNPITSFLKPYSNEIESQIENDTHTNNLQDTSNSIKNNNLVTEESIEVSSTVASGSDIASNNYENISIINNEENKFHVPNLPWVIDLLSKPNPTDKGHFPEILTADHKKFVISNGSCRPAGPFPKNKETNSHFSSYFYEMTNKAGVKIPRTWLCYSMILDCAYCEACWLFADRGQPNFQLTWIDGVSNWTKLSNKIKLHESSKIHFDACILFELWRDKKNINNYLEEQTLKENNFWRNVLHRIINVILTLSTCNLPFRGHRECIGDIGHNGIFLSIVEMLAIYDPVLKELILKPENSTRYLSPQIHNELIDLLSKTVKNKITNAIKEAPFFSIIMDTTQDITKVDQLSQIFRYVQIEKDQTGKPKKINVIESFLGFEKVDDQTAAGLVSKIITGIEAKGINIHKCRGQGYDGARVMSGIYTGVQKRILEKQDNATYVHCCAHNLNLVLNDSVEGISEVRNFYNWIESIYVFFANSIKRWDLLSSFLQKNEKHSALKLKRLCPTRWSSRDNALQAIAFRYNDIVQALSKIILISKSTEERNRAQSLKKEMEKFEFVFQVILHSKILTTTNAVSKTL